MTIRSSNPLQGHGSLFWIVAIVVPFAVFLVSWGLYKIVNIRAYYSLGLLLTLFVGAACAGFMLGNFERGPFEDAIECLSEGNWELRAKMRVMVFVTSLSTSVAAILLLVTIFAWISFALTQASLIEATVLTSSPATYSNFVSTYGWHLVDLVPGINVEKTLGVNPPVQFTGWLAGMPILMFRILTGVVAFTVIRRAWGKFTEIDARAVGNKNVAQ